MGVCVWDPTQLTDPTHSPDSADIDRYSIVGVGGVFGPLMIKTSPKIDSINEIGQIQRVALMPNLPEPYNMRDWKEVARNYDELFFNLSAIGTYLPLITMGTNHWGTEVSYNAYCGGRR